FNSLRSAENTAPTDQGEPDRRTLSARETARLMQRLWCREARRSSALRILVGNYVCAMNANDDAAMSANGSRQARVTRLRREIGTHASAKAKARFTGVVAVKSSR